MHQSKRLRLLLSLAAGTGLVFASALVPVGVAHASSTATVSAPTPFGVVRVGYYQFEVLTVTNHGPAPVRIDLPVSNSGGSIDFLLDPLVDPPVANSCTTLNGTHDLVASSVAPGGSCNLGVAFVPTEFGARATTMTVSFSDGSSTLLALSGTGVGGYYVAGASAEWSTFGWAPADLENPAGLALASPVVGMSGDGTGNGFWLDAADGGVITAGDAGFFGSMGGHHLNKPIVGMASTPTGKGYWLVASDGGIFTFGDAVFYGSTGAINLNKPIVGMAATPSGKGYWLVASDGGIFTFGDARFFGSTGAVRLNKPVVGMGATPTGDGYWMVASDGGIFTFGDAVFYGSTGAINLVLPIVGMAPSPTGKGYWLVASDGGIFTFGDVPFEGSLGAVGANDVVGMTPTNVPLFGFLPVTQASFAAGAAAVLAEGRLTPDRVVKAR